MRPSRRGEIQRSQLGIAKISLLEGKLKVINAIPKNSQNKF
jgi:hypothetical protein